MYATGAVVGERERVPANELRDVFTAEYGRLAGWCLRVTRDEQLSHDVAAEAFTRLVAKWPIAEPRPYLYAIATNLLKDHWRSAARESAANARIGAPDGWAADSSADLTMRDAIDRLNPRHRQVVMLYYLADLPVTEVADALGASPGSVKRWLFEARAALHVALREKP